MSIEPSDVQSDLRWKSCAEALFNCKQHAGLLQITSLISLLTRYEGNKYEWLVSGAILQSNLHLVEYPRPRTEKVRKEQLLFCMSWRQTSVPCSSRSHRRWHAQSLKRRSATHSDYLVAQLVRKSLLCISIHFASVLQIGGIWSVSGGIDLHSRRFIFDPGLGQQLKCGLNLEG